MAEPAPGAATQPDEFIQLPGLFQRWEIERVLGNGSEFRVEEADPGTDGTPLFAVWTRAIDATRTPRSGLPEHAPRRARDVRQSPEPLPELTGIGRTAEPAQVEPMSRGELKARRREEHLCFACTHHLVCGMANALDETLLVTISRCLGFESAGGAAGATCELIPIEPVAAP